MNWFAIFAIYFIIWWLTLFIVLPYGNRSQSEEGEVVQGTDPGAPSNSRIGIKLLINTLVAGVVFCLYWVLSDWYSLEFSDILRFFG